MWSYAQDPRSGFMWHRLLFVRCAVDYPSVLLQLLSSMSSKQHTLLSGSNRLSTETVLLGRPLANAAVRQSPSLAILHPRLC